MLLHGAQHEANESALCVLQLGARRNRSPRKSSDESRRASATVDEREHVSFTMLLVFDSIWIVQR